jgi:hypothetical protein
LRAATHVHLLWVKMPDTKKGNRETILGL